MFFGVLRKKYDVDDAVLFVDEAITPNEDSHRYGHDLEYERHGGRTGV